MEITEIHIRPRTPAERQSARNMRRIMAEARPGMRVQCIARFDGLPEHIAVPLPLQIYTVRELRRGLYCGWALGFTLEEVTNEIDADQGSEPFFGADAFEVLNPQP